jgi:broad specificity phosphatase PhoE
MPLTSIYFARHGQTEWALAGKHTGRSDIPLTPRGEREAVLLGERLRETAFTHVLTSPMQRARRTAELAGFAAVAQIEPDLFEWHYGEFEGLRTAEIHVMQPGWRLFRDGCRGGESVPEIAARADRLLEQLRRLDGSILLFAHGHILRVLAARFLELDASTGAGFYLGTAAICTLGYEHPPADPVIQLWNDRRHLDE